LADNFLKYIVIKYVMKNLYLCLMLSLGWMAFAQHSSMAKEVEKVEYLVEYNHYEEAQKKADSLLRIFKKSGNEYLEYELRVALQKGILYEIKEDNNKSLEILLSVVDKANNSKFHHLACHINIIIALVYEKRLDPVLAKKYLDEANRIRIKYKLDELESTILIRRSLYHRWFTKDLDSALYYSKNGYEFAKKYNNEYDIIESSLMIAIYEGNLNKNYEYALKYFPDAAKYYLKTNNYGDACLMYDNLATIRKRMGDLDLALVYSDTAFVLSKNASTQHQLLITKNRQELFEAKNNIDSAYHYLKTYRDIREEDVKIEEAANIKSITEKYDNDKKEATIKSKNQQMVFVIALLGLIVITSVLLIYQNRKIKTRNKIINKQLEELSRVLDQKQVLLSELQHRVKNNLQQVISILEIQKESIDFNNIEELVRGNQNRIQSMALLHKKLDVSDSVNEVDFKRYINELGELVKESYDTHKKNIELNIQTDIEIFTIEKALPLGLIITELISNSMKHAFKKRNSGRIDISIHKGDNNQYILSYSDNGVGFDFHTITSKGLGQEIIKGLIDQLSGKTTANSENGYHLSVVFK
jgi:two-component sensor histidine kinase